MVTDPATYRPRPGEIPLDAGVYRFRDADGRVIYVGKAKSLRPRLSSYFQDLGGLHPRTQSMVTSAAGVDWTVVANEVEALQLEYAWIKEHEPRFNVKYRDDKSYPYLAVTMGEAYPRAQVMRGRKRAGTRYFGPYAHAWAIRETLDLLLRVFPLRTCGNGVFRRAGQVGRPCLLGYIDKCSAPCVGRVDEQAHRQIAQDFCDFMAGDTGRFAARFQAQMRQAAAELDFETAARRRDDLAALRTALERSAVVLPDGTDADVYALAGDELEAAVQVFHVRAGRVRGQRGWVLERQDEDDAQLVEHLLQQVYGAEGADGVPRQVLVPALAADPAAFATWLSRRRGAQVDVRVPRRGDKKALMETVRRNAEQSLARHKVARAGDLTARGVALQELQEGLGLAQAPLRVECYDVSHIQGSEVVASMVVFEDGLPRKSEYRRFVVRGAGAQGDDTASLREVLTRRFRRLAEPDRGPAPGPAASDSPSAIDPDTGRPRRFAYAPQLVVVDGGAPQADAAAQALDDLGVRDVAVVGLAKRLEEVWLPHQDHPVILPRSSEGLYLLQRLRDEAHRFAITFHRQRRSKAMTASVLDGLPGVGPRRQAALLAQFGSVAAMASASAAELAAVPGIGAALAETIHSLLAAGAAERVAVNLTTGEVLDPGRSAP